MIRAKIVLSALVCGLLVAPLDAQIDPYPPDHERRGPSGIGGIGISIGLGGMGRTAEPPMNKPPLEMRDRQLDNFVAGQVLFFLAGDETQARRLARAGKVSFVSFTPLPELGLAMVVATLGPGDSVPLAVARLARTPGVNSAQPDFEFQVLGNSREQGAGLSGIRLGPKFRVNGTIVMIDSPVDLTNPALKGANIAQQGFGADMRPSPHGTAVAEILVGTGPFAGVAQGARLISLAAFAPVGEDWWRSQTSRVIVAADRALALRANVVNMSFGTRLDDPILARALDRFEGQGTCVVAAAGNGGGGPVLFPARRASVLAITAVDGSKRAYTYASRGAEIDVAAWGVAMNAAVPGGRRAVSGTSFATAIAAGGVLRLAACARDRNPAQMRAQIAAQAQDLGPRGRDDIFGAGLLRLR